MGQARVDAVVADMLGSGLGKGLKDLYRDLRDGADGWDASFALLVACRKARFDHGDEPLPGALRWWRVFNRLNDLALPVIANT